MDALNNRYDSGGLATFYAGEIISLELQIANGTSVIPLDDRVFRMVIFYQEDRTEIAAQTAIIKHDTVTNFEYASFAFEGDVSNSLYGQTGIGYQVVEQFEHGTNVLIDGKLKVKRSFLLDGILESNYASNPPVTRFTVSYNSSKPTILISQRGTPGLTGPAGKDGKDGKNGTNGRDGINGTNGKDGKNGINGVDGRPGLDGRNGTDGYVGRDGVDGRNGVDGLPGKDGTNGRDGVNGVDGAPGANGTNGLPGKDGKDGANGIDGAPGRDGTNGTNGTNGLPGRDGTNGNDGRNGIDGAPGAPGLPGTNGTNGTNGTDGAPGLDGDSAAKQLYDAGVLPYPTVQALKDFFTANDTLVQSLVNQIANISVRLDNLENISIPPGAMSAIIDFSNSQKSGYVAALAF